MQDFLKLIIVTQNQHLKLERNKSNYQHQLQTAFQKISKMRKNYFKQNCFVITLVLKYKFKTLH